MVQYGLVLTLLVVTGEAANADIVDMGGNGSGNRI